MTEAWHGPRLSPLGASGARPVEDCQTDDLGCPSEGAALRWTKSPVPYRLHARGYSKIKLTALRAAIRKAFDRWTTVDCNGERTSLRFVEETEAQPNEVDAPYAVTMVNEGWLFDDSALAQTTHDFGKDSGTVKNAVIQVNTASHDFRVAADDSPTALAAEAGGADIESAPGPANTTSFGCTQAPSRSRGTVPLAGVLALVAVSLLRRLEQLRAIG